ncbi:hypothetical protein [Pseudoroseomonas cervicalis]|uniref:hypothetical protein n=1 Tax=Teichococcus cervicalis TaxID=204525 RepID=UPI00278459BE|nr:hypothetical protein [Pseudoroseomonas cervicalis]MDQ1081415.1 hypothetical protein [Pseudoroseomonas cervicalis]
MTDRQTLLALADRVERAGGPDFKLDLAIARAVGALGDEAGFPDAAFSALIPIRHFPRYSASLDAAMGLVPEGWEWSAASCGDCYCADPEPRTVAYWGDARGPNAAALGLAAAALRARAAMMEGE